MGLFDRKHPDEFDQGQQDEEQYERLFPKIARDFVYREDLVKLLDLVMALLDPAGLSPVDASDFSNARMRALEYKSILESGQDGSKIFKDVIVLDD